MTTKEKKKTSGFMKPVKVSSELADIVGGNIMARTEVTAKIWDYIKKHKLQKSDNKRIIQPDNKLAKVCGKDAIDMFKMPKKIAEHITELETPNTR